jgi:6-phosphogluconate dehydrogenase
LRLSDDELHAVYDEWNQTELNAFLLEITARIFCQPDEKTGRRLIDVILDEAGQKGTGKWTSEEAMELQVPTPTIDTAVAARALSLHKEEREAASRLLSGPAPAFRGDREQLLDPLRRALYAGMILTFAQGLELLQAASQRYGYGLRLEEIARIWRGGCIIRAALLEKIRAAFHARPDLLHLLLDPALAREVTERQEDLRAVACHAAGMGLPAPGLMASLAYFDGCRSAWLPANLIQAQRDYFGAHTYERVDTRGVFHTEWSR